MKNLLLVLLSFFSVFAFAQSNKYAPTLNDKNPPHIKHLMQFDQNDGQNHGVMDKTMAESKGLQAKSFASSQNIYSLISTDQSVLTVDQAQGTIAFFARAGGGYGSSGDNLRISTASFGALSTWDEHIVVPGSGQRMRYPSGDLLSFPGAASATDNYAVFSGPVTNGAAWIDNFMGSVKLDGTNENLAYESLPGGTYFAHANSNLTACADSTVHVAGDNYVGSSTDYSWAGGLLVNGSYNAATNQVDWDPLRIMNHNFAIDSSDMEPAGGSASMAWSEDGSVGYYIFVGRDSVNDYRSYHPIIYKSLDRGATWNLEPVFDFNSLNGLIENLWPTLANPNLTKAYFSYQMDPVVDHNGMLHLFAIVKGSYSDHKDSLGYTFMWEPIKLFHLNMKQGGGWEAEMIQEMYTYDVSSDDQLFGAGADAMGWTHRVNASRTEDGEKLFVVWGDTDTTLAAPNSDGFLINSSPDIFAWGKDLVSNTTYPVTNFTQGTLFWGDNYFHYASNITYEDAQNNYIIPVSTAELGATPSDPVTHQLLVPVGFGTTIGMDEHYDNGFTVSQNFPNPFNDRTNIAVETTHSARLSLKVYNMIGQQVFQQDKGVVAAGAYNFYLSANNFKPGVYFYKVNASDQTITKKMIVK
ncbi:MAG: T9SS type A sorting domain-containing protein [Bacteroidota bacterium]